MLLYMCAQTICGRPTTTRIAERFTRANVQTPSKSITVSNPSSPRRSRKFRSEHSVYLLYQYSSISLLAYLVQKYTYWHLSLGEPLHYVVARENSGHRTTIYVWICVRILLHICPRIYICLLWRKRPLDMCIHHQVDARENSGPNTHVTRLLDIWPRTTMYVFSNCYISYCYMCVLIGLLYVCPNGAQRAPVRRLPDTTTYLFSYCCVFPHPHTTTYLSSYCCVCPHTPICVSLY
jgi:hypothetical protein